MYAPLFKEMFKEMTVIYEEEPEEMSSESPEFEGTVVLQELLSCSGISFSDCSVFAWFLYLSG